MTHKIRPVVSHNLPDVSHYVNAPSIKSLCNYGEILFFVGIFQYTIIHLQIPT